MQRSTQNEQTPVKEQLDDANEYVSPAEMQEWLKAEVADITRAMELRIKDAESFVSAYARGEISSDETAQRAHEYSCRWGDPLPGVATSDGLSDEDILGRLDSERIRQVALDRYLHRGRSR